MNGYHNNQFNEESGQGMKTMAPDTELDNGWDEAKLATLVGFDDSPEIPSETVTDVEEIEESNPSLNSNAISQSELFDDPIEGKTQPSFHKRGINKAVATGGVLLVGFSVVGIFLSNVFNSPERPAPSLTSNSIPIATPSVTPTPGTETGNLKTEVAIGKQADQIKALQGSRNPKMNVVKKTKQTETAPPPVSSPAPSPRTYRESTYTASPPRTVPAVTRQYTPPPSPTSTPSHP